MAFSGTFSAFSVSAGSFLKTLLRNLALSAADAILMRLFRLCVGKGFNLNMKVILNSEQIERILEDQARRIISETPPKVEIAVIGIRSRGEILAQRLAEKLSKNRKKEIPCGALDITLYRDDLNSPRAGAGPQVRTTEIGFDVDGKLIILYDDVLYTGRSTRAALDALIDLGRPKAIKLAVLVERSGREFPIQADYVGHKADVKPGKSVQVNLVESDGKDQVIIE